VDSWLSYTINCTRLKFALQIKSILRSHHTLYAIILLFLWKAVIFWGWIGNIWFISRILLWHVFPLVQILLMPKSLTDFTEWANILFFYFQKLHFLSPVWRNTAWIWTRNILINKTFIRIYPIILFDLLRWAPVDYTQFRKKFA